MSNAGLALAFIGLIACALVWIVLLGAIFHLAETAGNVIERGLLVAAMIGVGVGAPWLAYSLVFT